LKCRKNLEKEVIQKRKYKPRSFKWNWNKKIKIYTNRLIINSKHLNEWINEWMRNIVILRREMFGLKSRSKIFLEARLRQTMLILWKYTRNDTLYTRVIPHIKNGSTHKKWLYS
jgi:hypothetical protein